MVDLRAKPYYLNDEDIKWVKDTISNMTAEEKVGQLFLARCPDIYAAEDAAEYHLGGYILFGRDFEYKTYEEVCDDITSYQEASRIPSRAPFR